MKQGAINCNIGLSGSLEWVFGEKHQAVLAAPGFEQVLEGLAHHGLAQTAADPPDDVELREVVVDEELAHGVLPCWDDSRGRL